MVTLFQLCVSVGVSEYKLVLWATKVFLFGKQLFHNETRASVYWVLASDLVYAGTSCANSVIQIMRHFPTD